MSNSKWLVGIEDFGDRFRIFRADVEGYEQGTLAEFIPENSDLPHCMALGFAQECVRLWNESRKHD